MKNLKVNSFILFVLIAILSATSLVNAQTGQSSPSAELSESELTQNIKDRIKKIATQSSTLSQKRKLAFIGTIEKIANDTITIKTEYDINLASVSATTTFARLPGGSESKFSDVSIGDFAVAMGFINGSDVLQTKRILLYEKAPESTKKTSAAGLIKLIDKKEQAITLLSDGEEISVTLTKNTDISLQTGIEKTGISLDDLQVGQYSAVIYLPTPDEYTTSKALSILATKIIRELPKDDNMGSQSATLQSSPSSKPTIPPELIR